MKSKTKIVSTLLLTIFSLLFYFLFFPSFKSNAGTLPDLYFYMSRIKADLNGGTGQVVEYVVAFEVSQSFSSGGQVEITFPISDDSEWCRTAGNLIATGVTASAADLSGTDWDIDSALPDTGSGLSAACTQGNGSTTVDTITITAVGALSTATTYGVKITNGSSAGVIGTSATTGLRTITVEVSEGTTIDSKAFSVSILTDDQVVVSATVSAAPSVTCQISTNSVSLGTLYPGGSFVTATHTIGTSSSNAGYYWAAYGQGDGSTDAGLYKVAPSAYLIASTGSTTIDLTGGNAEGFGMTVSDPDAGGSAAVPSNFQTGTLGQFGALDRAAAGARLILYQSDEQASTENATITYGARASSSAVSGSYSETVTFVCGGYY
jgi:hypothetical protein